VTDDPITFSEPANDTWDSILDKLRRRYPGQKDSVLFCIYKLQQNPELTLRDFKAEADLYGIPTAGRALHSARVMLGLVKAEPKASAASVPQFATDVGTDRTRERRTRQHREQAEAGDSIENRVLAAVRQIQSSAGADSSHLRTAIRQAVAILQRALGE